MSASVGDITGVTAGVGLSGGGTTGALTITLDLSELSDVTPVNGDKLATLDSDGSTEQLTTIASLATLFAGTGLTASSSVIGIDAAQTGITSLLATDIKIGEDDQTKIDFETADEIHFYAANVEQVYLADNIFGPQSDSDVDLGTSSVRWKDAYVDTVTSTSTITTGAGVVIADAGNIGSASDTDALAISSGGVVNFTQQPTVSSAAVKVAGKETIWIPAAAMYPETTNGCSDLTQVELANGPELKCLDFATGSDEHAQFTVAFPKSWDEGTVTFKAYFTVTGTNTGTTAWGLAGGSFSDNGDLNTAFGTTVVATAKAHSGTSNDLDITAESGDVTIAGSPADEDLCFFQVMRDVSADDQSGDSRLLGIKLYFTTDAANDA